MIEWSLNWWSVFILSFLVMEFNAWALHRYVMHGFLWVLHKDHHKINKNRWWQWNDFFAFFFAVPSFLLILFSKLDQAPLMGSVGFGIMAYGIAYFFVHEVIIHQRLKIRGFNKGWYVKAVKAAHHVHHANKEKFGGENFGMLVVPLSYYKKYLFEKTATTID